MAEILKQRAKDKAKLAKLRSQVELLKLIARDEGQNLHKKPKPTQDDHELTTESKFYPLISPE